MGGSEAAAPRVVENKKTPRRRWNPASGRVWFGAKNKRVRRPRSTLRPVPAQRIRAKVFESSSRSEACSSLRQGYGWQVVFLAGTYLIRANVFWSSSKSDAFLVFSRVLAMSFCSRAFLVGRVLFS